MLLFLLMPPPAPLTHTMYCHQPQQCVGLQYGYSSLWLDGIQFLQAVFLSHPLVLCGRMLLTNMNALFYLLAVVMLVVIYLIHRVELTYLPWKTCFHGPTSLSFGCHTATWTTTCLGPLFCPLADITINF